jgi:hypothetical protein
MVCRPWPRRWGALGALASVLLLVPAAGADPTPLPSTELDALPGARREDVIHALRKVRLEYGEDAVLIEAQLLLNAMRSGAQRATGVRVDGLRTHRGKRYLRFDVETGLVFDSATRDEAARVQMLWRTIMVPTFERVPTLEVAADGVMIALTYHHRAYRSQNELHAAADQPGTAEETIFYVLASDVDAAARRTVAVRDLLARILVTVDDGERRIAAADPDAPTAPGPE